MRRPAILTILALLAGLFAVLAPAGSAQTFTASSYTSRLLTLVNNARADHGLRPLTLTSGTTTVAAGWSATMARQQVLSHNPNLGHEIETHGSPNWTTYGENVGEGMATDPDGLFKAYMNSPEHRENILLRAYRYVGVATVFSGKMAWNTFDFVDSYGTSTTTTTTTTKTTKKTTSKPAPKPAPAPAASPTQQQTAPVAAQSPKAKAPEKKHETKKPARKQHERPAVDDRIRVKGLQLQSAFPASAASAPLASTPVSVVDDLSAPVQGPRRAVIVAIAVLALVAAARRWVLVGARLA
jgi:hypothetical protein